MDLYKHLIMKHIFCTFLILISFHTSVEAQDIFDRIEPANWWTEMKHNNIQILFYGEDISHLEPVSGSGDLIIEKTIRVENPNYLFLYVEISDSIFAGSVPVQFYDKNKLVTSIQYPLLKRDEDRKFLKGFDGSDVMYLITPDRFVNGDPGNDEVEGLSEGINRTFKGGRYGGDIRGIMNSLDYISEMGFTAIWLNPVLENNMPEYSYHGYAATDFYKVDQRFGSNELYREMVSEAKKKGIKVIMDMIVNHSGSEHWFVKDLPMHDWLNFQDGFVPTSHRRNTVQDLYVSEYDQKKFSDGWFVETMPDLNQRNELLGDYLIQNAIWWIEYSGISGIRMDTYPYPDKHYMTRWTCAVMKEYPDFNIVGEEWTSNPAIVSYWQAGKENHDGYSSCLPSLMDFPLQDALAKGLVEDEKHYGSGLINIYEALTMDFLYSDPDKLVIFPDNHDMDRFFTQVDNDMNLFKMGMAYMATMRGTPQIYYGTEVLMENNEAPGDHGIIRSEFPGGWPDHEVNAFTGEGLTGEQKEAQQYIKKLLNWRNDKEVIHTGKLLHFAPENGVYTFFRYNESEKVMVILNKNQSDFQLDTSKYKEILAQSETGTDIITGKTFNLTRPFPLKPLSAYIIEINTVE